MVKKIPLTQGQVALVDEEDFERLNQWKWFAHRRGQSRRFYAARNSPTDESGRRRMVHMHREVIGAPDGIDVDHKRVMDTLDNRKNNLRLASPSQNQGNTGVKKSNSSGYKGVCWDQGTNSWLVQLRVRKAKKLHQHFALKDDAARAYDKAAREHFGEFARLNFPDVAA